MYRTLLFVPGHQERMLERCLTRGADAVVLDLEDGVPIGEKYEAREIVRRFLDSLTSTGRTRLLVRINPLGSGLEESDVQSVAASMLYGFVVPKVERPSDIHKVSEMLTLAEGRLSMSSHKFAIFPIIESASGLEECLQIARASERVAGLIFGAEDFCADLGWESSPGRPELQYPRCRVAVAARAAHVVAIDSGFPDIYDEDGLRADTLVSRRFGFVGKIVPFPRQIPVIHDVFTPSESEVTFARKVVAAYDEAVATGSGATVVDGKFVDQAIVLRAQRTLSLCASEEK